MKSISICKRLALVCNFVLLAVLSLELQASTPQFPNPITINPDQTLTYNPTPKGDRVPDFSTVGYNYGNSPLPDEPGGIAVPVLVTLSPGTGDQTDRIQAAIDYISAKPLVNGFRGALLLKAGRWEIHSVNKIAVKASGVVIRGEGDHPLTGTRIYAIGTTNENSSSNTRNSRLIAFAGNSNSVNTSARTFVDAVYVPTGTSVIPITGHAFTVGQRIQVRWPGTVAWQKASLYNSSATADVDPAITFNRVIAAVTANSITLDASITSPLDPAYAIAYVVTITAFNHITNVGVSNCYFESTYANDTDENHVWCAVDFTNVEDGFMHNCTARYFAYTIAYVNTSTRKITINRSQYLDGISQLVGGRRYNFVLTGEMGLVSNAVTRYGRHSFVINWPAAPGPNVFVDGVSSQSYNESGSHGTWNNGGLWDNISTLNATVGLQVKLERPSASCVAWNCVTNTITFENMPLTPNWSFGTTSSSGGVPTWRNSSGVSSSLLGKAEVWSSGTRMSVRSLYEKQVETRLAAAGNPHRYQANLPTRVNYLPVIRTPDQLVALSGATWSYQLPVSNIVPATRTPNYAVTGLPAGLSVNATTGLISGTLPTVSVPTNYTLSISARNIDGTATKAMTLTVRPAGSPKIPLAMSLEVDMDRTTPLPIKDTTARPVPMVPASRLLAPMIVRKSYKSDMNGSTYTASDVPVPVAAVLSIEGLTSPVTITYNGSTTLPTASGYYDIVATLDDPIYSATATGQLLVTDAGAVTVTLGNTSAPTASSPVTATSTQPSITPVITYDGLSSFPEATGFYAAKAVVANAAYFGSSTALIRVPPKITQQPVSLTVNQGMSATFAVSATGISPTYQWRKAGVAISGATASSYTIASAQAADTATYDVVITDQTGTVTSVPVTLTVIVPPQITQQPVSQSVGQGMPVTFTVVSTGGVFTCQWRKDGVAISGATGSSYTIAAAATSDAGSYDVVVSNALGSATSASATLTVVTPPQITGQPVSQTINQGASATFAVSATGIGNTYQWRKSGMPITGATGTSYTIHQAQAADAGSYDVVVTNIAGSVTSTPVTLTVVLLPQITQQPVSQVTTLGAPATFTVAATGISVTYQWRKGGMEISGATEASYTIAAAEAADAGSYDVVVATSAGSVTSASVALTVLNPGGIQKLNNTTALDLGGSWTGGIVPGSSDTALWNGTYSSGSVSIGTGISVGRIQISSPSTGITINAGSGPLTLGGGGIDLSAATQNLTINAPIFLGNHQTWTVNTGRTLTFASSVTDGGLARRLTLTGSGTFSYNGADNVAPFPGLLSVNAGTLRANQAAAVLTLNASNLPADSSLALTSLTGASGATWIIDAAPTAALSFASNTAGLNLILKNGAVTYNAVSGSTDSTNVRVEGGVFTISATAARYQLAAANQTFQVTGGTVDVTKVTSFGLRVGGSGSASQTGAQTVTATQSGGSLLTTTLNLGGTDTTALKSPSYTLTGGNLSLTSSFTIGADTAGSGTSTFTLGGSGKLVVPGTISGAQSGARQIFTMNGGTLAVATLNTTNLRSADTSANGTFTQSGGTLAPGDVGTAGRTAITGSYTLGSGGTLALDLGGTTAATAFQGTASQFDNLTVSGTTTLSGNLGVSLINGYTPTNNTTFTIVNSSGALSGNFANVAFGSRLLVADGSGSFQVNQVGNAVTLSNFLPIVITAFVTPGADGINLDWTGSMAVSYDLDRALSADGPFTRIATGLMTTQFTDTSIVPGVQYHYRLTGTDALGRTTTVTSGPPPASPAGLAVTPGFTTNALSWAAVSAATGHRVRRALVATGPFVQIASLGAADTSFTDTALATGTTYFYVITAINTSGESAPSAIVSGTPVPGTATKANNTTTLDLGSSWSTGVVPTVLDTALWNGTYASGSVSVGSGLAVSQLRLTSPSQAITLNSGTGSLTLGAGGLDLSTSSQNLTVNAPVILADNQTWAVNTGRTLTLNGDINEADSDTTLTKSGAGTLVLAGPANTWTGATLVNAGTLRLGTGATLAAGSGLTVATGATLSGTGSIQGPVTINGTLAPGLSGAGKLNLQTTLTLGSTSTTTLNIHRSSPASASAIAGPTLVTFGGTLTVTNAGPALVDGDRFVLFSAAAFSGSFATLNLPALDTGLVWDTRGLAVDGSIVVRASIPAAGTKYWDTSADPGLQGGAGVWDSLATANWNPAADGTGVRTTFWHLDTVLFQNGLANTVTLPAPVSVTALSQSINGTATTLSGGTLNLAGSTPLSNGVPSGNSPLTIEAPVRVANSAVTITAAQPILLGQGLGGSGNITKSGNSSLTIDGDSDWTGALILNGGTTAFNGAAPGIASIAYGPTATSISNSNLQLAGDADLSSLVVRNLGSNTLDIATDRTLSVTGNVVLGLNGNTTSIDANSTTSIAFTGGGSASFTNLGGNFIVAGGKFGGIVTADFSGLSSLTINTGAGNAYLGVYNTLTSDTLRFAPDTTLTAANFYVGDANTGGTFSLVLGSGENTLNVDTLYVGQTPGANNRSDGSITFPAGSTNASLRLRAADGTSRANLSLNDNSSTTGRLLTTTFDSSGRSADLLLNNLVIGRRNASSSPAQLTNDTFRWDRGTLDVLQQVVLSQAPAAAQKLHVGTMVLGSANSTTADTAIFRGGIFVAENCSTVTTAAARSQATLTIAGGSITSAGITLGDIVTTTAPSSGTRQSTATLNVTGGTLTLTAPLRSGSIGGPGTKTATLNLDGGTLDLGGNALGGTGAAALTTLNFLSGTLANVASINGSAGLTKTGTGSLTLAGTNTFSGPVTVSNGTFILAPGATATTSVSVNSGATVVPAGSITGNLTAPTGSTVRFRLDSATSYDQLILTGATSTITLGGTLDLVAAPDLPAGTRFRILRNQGNPTAAVVGIFAGRAPKQPFTLAGRTWYLDYATGSGGDVDLVLASDIELWRQTNFGTLFATGTAADSYDADFDGLENLLEYALGTIPTSAASVARPVLATAANHLTLTFNRIADPTLIYQVEASPDLSAASWSSIWQSTGAQNTAGPVTVTDSTHDIDTSTPPRRFLRLRVR
jgi:autotransporter-associated beta strand protein